MANAPRLTLDSGGELDRPSLHSRKTSGDADVPPESVGQDLCKARQRRGKELTDVWLVLNIRPDYLIAIEEGRFEALPDRVYAIGYVRSYAAHLGLDAEKFVDRLKTEIAARGGVKDPPADGAQGTFRFPPIVNPREIQTKHCHRTVNSMKGDFAHFDRSATHGST